jgi:quinol monooxygenase YgiN
MFARVVQFSPDSDAAAEFVRLIQEKVLPIVCAQPGCIVAFVEPPRKASRSVLGVSVWDSKMDAEHYSRECFPDIENMLRPFLKRAPKLRTFEVREIRDVAVLDARWGAKPTSLLVQ